MRKYFYFIGQKNKRITYHQPLNYSPLNVLTDCLKWEIPVNTDYPPVILAGSTRSPYGENISILYVDSPHSLL
ncbi:hypothetical protein V7457_14480, partial [Bacillus toyonensis]